MRSFESNGLSCKSFAEDLETSSESQKKVDGVHFLDVVVRKSSVVLKFFTSENKSNLICWESFFFVKLGFKVSDCLSRSDVKSESLSCNSFAEDLH